MTRQVVATAVRRSTCADNMFISAVTSDWALFYSRPSFLNQHPQASCLSIQAYRSPFTRRSWQCANSAVRLYDFAKIGKSSARSRKAVHLERVVVSDPYAWCLVVRHEERGVRIYLKLQTYLHGLQRSIFQPELTHFRLILAYVKSLPDVYHED